MFVRTSNAKQEPQRMTNKEYDESRHNGELSLKEKEDLIFASVGALRAETRSLAKQIDNIKKLERNILVLLLFTLASAVGFCVFLFSLV